MDLGSNMETGHYVVLEDGKPVAFATMKSGDELVKLYVHPEYRKRHIADKLIKHIMADLKSNGEDLFFIERTTQFHNFWSKFVENNKLECQEVTGETRVFIQLN